MACLMTATRGLFAAASSSGGVQVGFQGSCQWGASRMLRPACLVVNRHQYPGKKIQNIKIYLFTENMIVIRPDMTAKVKS